MSTAAADRPPRSGRAAKLWLGFLLVIAAGIGLAWIGAGAMRPQVSDSGLQFRTVKDGTGEPIGQSDAAVLDYVLTTDDGNVMDSSESHGGAQPFIMAQVFPGFAEAMSKMKEGGQYHFTMPKALAFTDGQTPPGFTGEHLTFDVQVRKIVRGGAAMVQQMQAQQAGGQAPQ